jgi:hypothetical protein
MCTSTDTIDPASDILEAAREAQAAPAEKVSRGTLRVPAPKREPPSDLPVTRADILRLADVLSRMLDIHDEVDARLARLEQASRHRR